MVELSPKEQKILEALLKKLKIAKQKGKKKLVVGLIGLVGSGKTAVAEKLARELQATVVSADAVRVMLRKKKLDFDHTREIVFELTREILLQDGSVVIDSDFASAHKRNDLKKIAKDGNARLYFVRTVKDFDVMVGDIISVRYGAKERDVFVGAATSWKGMKKPAVVKLREMARRLPHHYLWSKDGGGQWIQKTIPDVHATVDTTENARIARQVSDIAKRFKR